MTATTRNKPCSTDLDPGGSYTYTCKPEGISLAMTATMRNKPCSTDLDPSGSLHYTYKPEGISFAWLWPRGTNSCSTDLDPGGSLHYTCKPEGISFAWLRPRGTNPAARIWIPVDLYTTHVNLRESRLHDCDPRGTKPCSTDLDPGGSLHYTCKPEGISFAWLRPRGTNPAARIWIPVDLYTTHVNLRESRLHDCDHEEQTLQHGSGSRWISTLHM